MNNPTTAELIKWLRGITVFLTPYSETMLGATADRLEALEQELIDERYRHDRLQDFCVEQGAELSEIKARQRWIPVAEPPKEDERVFAFCHEQVFVAYYHPRLGFISDETGHRLYDISHWKPLPEPPKE